METKAQTISTFNDSSSALSEVAKRFGLELATFSRNFLTARDEHRLTTGKKSASERTKAEEMQTKHKGIAKGKQRNRRECSGRTQRGSSIIQLESKHMGAPIIDFRWSNDGTEFVIAYFSNPLLVGTPQGQ